MKGFAGERLRGCGRVIAINEAGLTMCPWADVHYFPDWRYIEWNIDRLGLYQGPLRITRMIPKARPGKCPEQLWQRILAVLPGLDIKIVERDANKSLSMLPTRLAGVDGGSNAVNMAALFGAARIILLGFDMRASGNYHDKHKTTSQPIQFERFREDLGKMAVHLERAGIEVLNATPGSELTCFPTVNIGAVL